MNDRIEAEKKKLENIPRTDFRWEEKFGFPDRRCFHSRKEIITEFGHVYEAYF